MQVDARKQWHLKQDITTIGNGKPLSREGSEGNFTLRKVPTGLALFVKHANIWYDVNELQPSGFNVIENNAVTLRNVGVGTNYPASTLEIQGGTGTGGAILTLGTKETAVDADDVLGRINFYAPREASGTDANLVAASIVAVAEHSYTDALNTCRLEFQTAESAVATTKMTINRDGYVGIADLTPSKLLDLKNGASGGDILAYDVYTHDGGVTSSDERLKTNITDSSLGLSFINALKPRSYKWKDTSESTDADGNFFEAVSYTRTHYGMIAQEVKQVMDDLSLTDKDFAGWCYEEDRDLYVLRYTEFIAPLMKAVQELSVKMDSMQEEINNLKG